LKTHTQAVAEEKQATKTTTNKGNLIHCIQNSARGTYARYTILAAAATTTNTMDELIKLNVAGTCFTTTRATLCAETGSMLAAKFSEDCPFAPPTQDADGNYYLDRNPDIFLYLLKYLRSSCRLLPNAPKDDDELDAIEAEADYFGLAGLVAICRDKKKKKLTCPVYECKVITEKIRVTLYDCNEDNWSYLTKKGYRLKQVTSSPVLDSEEHVFVTTAWEKL